MAKKKTSPERVVILIDGGNFYHRLKEDPLNIRNLLNFDFDNFANLLAGKRKIVEKNYYLGKIRAKPQNKKAMKLMANQQRLTARLRASGWRIYFGYLLKADRKYREKGVDVKIAVDLLVGAYKDKYDAAILVSSDTDLLPAILKVRELGKKIEYVGFSHKPSLALIANTDFSKLLAKDDLLPFAKKVKKGIRRK